MLHRTWAYVLSIILAGAFLSGLVLSDLWQPTSQWPAFLLLTALCIGCHFFKARGAGHEAWHANLVALFAGVLLLTPGLFALLVILPHVTEWIEERMQKGPGLRNWAVQPFNMATHVMAGLGARWVHMVLDAHPAASLTESSVLAVAASAITYLLLNHALVGYALVLARRTTWRESGALRIVNLETDLVLLLLGYVLAVLWQLNPWLILPALSPLLLIYRTLRIPRLEKQARTDDKTGLWNARYFSELLTIEIERAGRFGRTLALIVADLDLLRNINNTYGHLAGDQVLAGIGDIIRRTSREYDIAARFGGEEFTIVLPESGLAEALAFAERLRRAIEAAAFQVTTSSTPIRTTMSFGVACFPQDGTTATRLIHEADVAVYQAKLDGRNRVVCASEVVPKAELGSAALTDRLRACPVPTLTSRGVGL
jgi:diguanylate cyclase (GGDEF)-like protein